MYFMYMINWINWLFIMMFDSSNCLYCLNKKNIKIQVNRYCICQCFQNRKVLVIFGSGYIKIHKLIKLLMESFILKMSS